MRLGFPHTPRVGGFQDLPGGLGPLTMLVRHVDWTGRPSWVTTSATSGVPSGTPQRTDEPSDRKELDGPSGTSGGTFSLSVKQPFYILVFGLVTKWRSNWFTGLNLDDFWTIFRA